MADVFSHDEVREKLFSPTWDDLMDEEKLAALEKSCYREASEKMLAVLAATLNFLLTAKNAKDRHFRCELMGYVFGIQPLSGMSMDDLGARHCKKRATISNQVLRFQRAVKFPEVLAQKLKETRKEYSKTRIKKCKPNTNN